jgi:hypothetical protein
MKKKYEEPKILTDHDRQVFVIKELLELAYNDIGFADKVNKLIFPFTSVWTDEFL